jgi:AcrR family transcriptional regulator
MTGDGRASSRKATSGGISGGGPLVGAPHTGAHAGGNGAAAHDLGREHPFGHEHPDGHRRVIEIQRARILAAMVEVSAERGAGNVTVAHIVERAGVSRRTFYELFSDREECFLGAFEDAVKRARGYVLDSYDPTAKWAGQLRSALTGLLTFLDVERGAGRLLIVGSLGAGTKALESRGRVLAQMITLVDEGRTLTGTGRSSKTGSDLPPLTAEGIVGGVLSILHSRLLADDPGSLVALTGPLMGMIVLPYLGPAAARRELAKPAPKPTANVHHAQRNPLGELEMRLTYRTVRVLMAIAAHPGSSNRTIADTAEVTDQGQMSKLLARLHGLGLIANTGGGASRGEPNAWTLTERGWQVQGAIAAEPAHD